MAILFAGLILAAPRPVVGAIRWDAWHGAASTVGLAVERSLGPAQWHHRLPFFGRVVGPEAVEARGNTQAVVDREIDYAADAGIDYWAFVTYDLAAPMSDGLKLYLASDRRERIAFCHIVEAGRLGPATLDEWVTRLLGSWAEPTYQRVLDGRPLLYLFQPDHLVAPGRFESWAAARAGIDRLREAARAAGVGEPYVVGQVWSPAAGADQARQLGLDALGAYAANAGGRGASYAELATGAEGRWDQLAATGLPVVPLVTSGWDRRPRVINPVPWEGPRGDLAEYYEAPTPAELAAHLRRGLDWCDRHEAAQARAVLIYAWNEFDEGGWLCPTLAEGTARLDAIREVLRP